MKKLILLAMALGLLMSGCSIAATEHWVPKPGQSAEDFWKDRDQCMSGKLGGQFPGLPSVEVANKKEFNSCMRYRGYMMEKY
jgi:hypothetical protein